MYWKVDISGREVVVSVRIWSLSELNTKVYENFLFFSNLFFKWTFLTNQAEICEDILALLAYRDWRPLTLDSQILAISGNISLSHYQSNRTGLETPQLWCLPFLVCKRSPQSRRNHWHFHICLYLGYNHHVCTENYKTVKCINYDTKYYIYLIMLMLDWLRFWKCYEQQQWQWWSWESVEDQGIHHISVLKAGLGWQVTRTPFR